MCTHACEWSLHTSSTLSTRARAYRCTAHKVHTCVRRYHTLCWKLRARARTHTHTHTHTQAHALARLQVYSIQDSALCLTGTAEVPLGGLYMDKVLQESDLPIRMAAFGHCFRTGEPLLLRSCVRVCAHVYV